MAESRDQGQPASRVSQTSPSAPRAPPNSPEPELDDGHEDAVAGPSNPHNRRAEPAQTPADQQEQQSATNDGGSRTIIDVCTSLLSLAAMQPEDRANWIRTLRTDAAWLTQLARVLERQQLDEDHRAEDTAERGQEHDGKGKGKGKAEDDTEEGEGKGNMKVEGGGEEGKDKGTASDVGKPEAGAQNRPRAPLIWRPADYGNDFNVRPTYEEWPREVYFGTVEDDAATCQPHMY